MSANSSSNPFGLPPAPTPTFHLIENFDQGRALDYLHSELPEIEHVWQAGVAFVDQQSAAASKTFERLFVSYRAADLFTIYLGQIAGLVLLDEQDLVPPLSAASIEITEYDAKNMLAAPHEHLAVKKAHMRINCTGYYNVAKHIVADHVNPFSTDPDAADTWWHGLADAYTVTNKQLAIDRGLLAL